MSVRLASSCSPPAPAPRPLNEAGAASPETLSSSTRGTEMPAHLWNGQVPGRYAEKAWLPRRNGDTPAVSPGTLRHGGGELMLSAAHLYNRESGSATKAQVQVVDVGAVRQLTGRWPIDDAALQTLAKAHPEIIARQVALAPPETGSLGSMPPGEYSVTVKGDSGPVQAMLLNSDQFRAAMTSTPTTHHARHASMQPSIADRRSTAEWTRLLSTLLGQENLAVGDLPRRFLEMAPGALRPSKVRV
ncbi:MAG: hypothetical protein Q8O67_30970 [Deltaproteobacteria bacterium]|nr:hypothetical protein [Deltaproteobacteria bacterium]